MSFGSLFSFKGRARRSHWWLTQLGLMFGFPLSAFILELLLSVTPGAGLVLSSPSATSNPYLLSGTVLLMFLAVWISLAVDVRRCHDRDHSGWYLLLWFVPFIGWIWLLLELAFFDSVRHKNKHGRSPKEPGGDAPAFA